MIQTNGQGENVLVRGLERDLWSSLSSVGARLGSIPGREQMQSSSRSPRKNPNCNSF